MKPILLTIAIAGILSGCSKETICIGNDCVLPEAIILLDSVTTEGIFVTMPNNEGGSFHNKIALAENIDATEFQQAAMGDPGTTMPMSGSSASLHLEVYYISVNQEYVQQNARYIHANETTFEIVNFGEDL